MTVVDGLLSPEECRYLIDYLDTPDKLHTLHNSMAEYDRSIWINDEWADRIFTRVKPHLPQEIREKVGINNYLRFSKYKDGGRFDRHVDGMNVDKDGRVTIMTVNIFLNSEFTGGETDFFDNFGNFMVRAAPLAGRGAVFDRGILHCGNVVHGGYKYLIRTDIMGER